MRTSIASLTRPDYADLVQIRDHSSTTIQCIGDVIKRSCPDKIQIENLNKHRVLWPARVGARNLFLGHT